MKAYCYLPARRRLFREDELTKTRSEVFYDIFVNIFLNSRKQEKYHVITYYLIRRCDN